MLTPREATAERERRRAARGCPHLTAAVCHRVCGGGDVTGAGRPAPGADGAVAGGARGGLPGAGQPPGCDGTRRAVGETVAQTRQNRRFYGADTD